VARGKGQSISGSMDSIRRIEYCSIRSGTGLDSDNTTYNEQGYQLPTIMHRPHIRRPQQSTRRFSSEVFSDFSEDAVGKIDAQVQQESMVLGNTTRSCSRVENVRFRLYRQMPTLSR
jgi:hypothetical protein